jgi:hypothetical protein
MHLFASRHVWTGLAGLRPWRQPKFRDAEPHGCHANPPSGDVGFEIGEIRQFVDAFLADHGGISGQPE